MLLPILAAALAAPLLITDVDADRTGGELRVHIHAAGALSGGQAEVKNHQLVLSLPGATLASRSETFHHHHRYIQVRRTADGVRIEVPISKRVDCSGPVALLPRPDGMMARAECERTGGEEEEDDEPVAVPAPAATVPTTVVARPPVTFVAPELNIAGAAPAAARTAIAPAAIKAPSARPALPAARPATAAKPMEMAVPEIAPLTVRPPAPPAAAAAAAEPTMALPASAAPVLAATHAASLGSTVLPALALLALAGAAFFFGRRRAIAPRLLRVVETASLGPKRSLVLARVGGETLLLSTSEAGVALIAQLSADKLAAVEPAPAHQDAPRPLRDRLFALLPKANARRSAFQPSFEDLFAEAAEDQELRHKLAAGISGQVQ